VQTDTAGWRTEPPAGSADTDADVIERSARDPASFGLIFDRHSDAILRYAYARLGPDLAEDVLAETFLAAFARRASYDKSRPSALPWLYGIAISSAFR
jgi:DNA-directed RNA polymerase specialized sigma24 family protein